MSKRKITPKPSIKDFINSADESQPTGKYIDAHKNRPYAEKKAKGRSISMQDDFYEQVKNFAKDNPELGGISQMTVRALSEFMKRYNV